ncbi:hypothetical protein INP02_13305, partial [Staphylococcus aureus]|nr:hypothetical protein [Staphylococcus aureus]
MSDGKEERGGIHDRETHGRSKGIDENTSPEDVKAPNLIERAKEEVEALVGAMHHPNKDHHHQTLEKEGSSGKFEKTKTHKKETHGTSE